MQNKQLTTARSLESVDLSKGQVLDIIRSIVELLSEDKDRFKEEINTLLALEGFVLIRSDEMIRKTFSGIFWFVDMLRFENGISKDDIIGKIQKDFMISHNRSIAREIFG